MRREQGRRTVRPGEDVAVFLIGMRVNRPVAAHRWVPSIVAMARMQAELAADPELGMLGGHNWFGRTTIMLSYWRSAEHLQHFAADPDRRHLPAWRRFGAAMRDNDALAVWHETYVARAGSYEAIYVNMPAFGLGKALGTVPVGPDAATARRRMATGARG